MTEEVRETIAAFLSDAASHRKVVTWLRGLDLQIQPIYSRGYVVGYMAGPGKKGSREAKAEWTRRLPFIEALKGWEVTRGAKPWWIQIKRDPRIPYQNGEPLPEKKRIRERLRPRPRRCDCGGYLADRSPEAIVKSQRRFDEDGWETPVRKTWCVKYCWLYP